jgi:hypothetical protein
MLATMRAASLAGRSSLHCRIKTKLRPHSQVRSSAVCGRIAITSALSLDRKIKAPTNRHNCWRARDEPVQITADVVVARWHVKRCGGGGSGRGALGKGGADLGWVVKYSKLRRQQQQRATSGSSSSGGEQVTTSQGTPRWEEETSRK